MHAIERRDLTQDDLDVFVVEIKAGFKFNNVVKKPEKKFVKKMFDMENRELGLSASRLEEYSKCPSTQGAKRSERH